MHTCMVQMSDWWPSWTDSHHSLIWTCSLADGGMLGCSYNNHELFKLQCSHMHPLLFWVFFRIISYQILHAVETRLSPSCLPNVRASEQGYIWGTYNREGGNILTQISHSLKIGKLPAPVTHGWVGLDLRCSAELVSEYQLSVLIKCEELGKSACLSSQFLMHRHAF